MAFSHVDGRATGLQARRGHAFRPIHGAARGGIYRRAGKRVLDVLLVLMAIPFLVPVVAALAVLVRRDGGPAFYTQNRVGRGGRVYRMWKLRTMVLDADRSLAAHLAANPCARAEWVRTQKLRDDPRITPFGRVLRKTSLDELPQLYNVLLGDMSLVGPRPMMVNQTGLYPGTGYFHVRPGVSGYWQICDRNCTSFRGRVHFDDAYVRDLSLWTDVWVMLRTVRVVIRGTGV